MSRPEIYIESSGDDALAQLMSQPITVVIAGIGVIGMSGTDLQRKIMNEFTQMVHIILSGLLDGKSIIESSKFSERRLCKPSPMTTIRQEVEKALIRRRQQ